MGGGMCYLCGGEFSYSELTTIEWVNLCETCKNRVLKLIEALNDPKKKVWVCEEQ